MKKVLIALVLVSLVILVGCNNKSNDKDIESKFDDCRKDIDCYYDSFSEWAGLFDNKQSNFSCGLILYEGQQIFVQVDEDLVTSKLNYCDSDENLYNELQRNNITHYVILKILYLNNLKPTIQTGYNKDNYLTAQCFFSYLFESNDDTSKFDILERCENELR